MNVVMVIGGVLLLYLGGEGLVRGATRLARQWGVSPMVVGLTIVALGTSTPELFASLVAALDGSPDIALGNVVGSNVANIGLILGVTALIQPIRTKARFLRREVPFMVGVAVLLILLLVLAGGTGRLAGLLLLALIGAYLVVLLRGTNEPEVEEEFVREYEGEEGGAGLRSWLFLGVGIALLAFGARLLVTGATEIARAMGIPELTIGLTLVAVGTSLPELFASLVAALRKEPEIALGNVVGSNVLNVLFILGAVSLVRPIAVDPGGAIIWDSLIMLAFTVALVPFLVSGLRLGRREGFVLLLAYGGYLFFLFGRG